MTERRPHWDDALIEAVADVLERDDFIYATAYAVIAAVEDWQEREKTRCKSDTAYHCATHDTQWLDDESDRCEYKRMVDAEAAIQRVRDVPKKVAVARRGDVGNPQKFAWYQGWNEAIDAVFRTLDGGAA